MMYLNISKKTMKNTNIFKALILSTLLILLNSCEALKYKKVSAKDYPPEPEKRIKKNMEEGRGARLFGDGGFGSKKSGTFDFASSNELWRAALDTIDFMPLVSANYSGGIIITDWYTDSKSRNQAIKITIRFLTNEIRVDALDIKVFKKNCMADQITNCTIITENGTLVAELKKNILKKAAIYEKIKKEKNFKPYEVGKPDNPRGRNKKKD